MIVPATASQLAVAVERLAAGQLVVFPTETVYGLGADASCAAAVARIYALKGRPHSHPLIVHVHNADQAQHWAHLDARAQALVQAFWPGPLTLVLPRRATAPAWACADQPSVGLRCPAHPVAQALLAAWAQAGGQGLAAPSANRFGRVSPTRAQHVLDDLGPKAPLVLDGGAAEVGVESTILDLTRAQPVLLRPGRITVAALEQVLGLAVAQRDAAAPRAPGTLPAHYQPRTPLELCPAAALPAHLAALAPLRLIAWAPGAPLIHLVEHWEPMPDAPHRLEQDLYDTLRRLDGMEAARIVVATPPPGPAWAAVHDRLSRAAGAPNTEAEV